MLKSVLGLFLRSKTMSTRHKQSNNSTKKGLQCTEQVRILELLAGTRVTQSSCSDKIVPPWCRLTEAVPPKNLNPLSLPYLAYSSMSNDHVELLSWWEESHCGFGDFVHPSMKENNFITLPIGLAAPVLFCLSHT